jgi:hypothetical protein
VAGIKLEKREDYYSYPDALGRLGYGSAACSKKIRDSLEKIFNTLHFKTRIYYLKNDVDKFAIKYVDTTCKQVEFAELLDKELNKLTRKLVPHYQTPSKAGGDFPKLFEQYGKIILEPYTDENPSGNRRFYCSDVKDIADNLVRDYVEIYNVDGSNYNINNIKELSLDIIETKYYTSESYRQIYKKEPRRGHWIGKVPMIKIRNAYYFRKEHIDFMEDLKCNTISIDDLIIKIKNDIGKSVSKSSLIEYVVENNIPYYSGRDLQSTSRSHIEYDYVETVLDHYRRIAEYDECKSTFEKVKLYMKYSPLKNNNIHETLKDFDEFMIERFNKKARNTKERYKCSYYAIYDMLMSKLSCELKDITSEKFVSLSTYLMNYSNKFSQQEFGYFYNTIMKKYKISRNITVEQAPSVRNEVLPYELEKFLEMYGTIFLKMQDKKWINRLATEGALASATLYIAVHYLSAWRSVDIRDIPFPNLKLINFRSPEKFLEFIKEDSDSFTDSMGQKICMDIENKIKLWRKKAKKNKGNLVLYINDSSKKHIGMLLAICEAHRQIRENKIRKNGVKNIGSGSTLIYQAAIWRRTYFEEIFEERTDYLFEQKTFGNRKANKAFMTYIQNKSEEWGLGVGYLLDSILRGHKLDERLISETTQIYIKRAVDKTTIRIFTAGIFGGIKHKLLELVYEDYEDLSLDERAERVKELKILPSEVESMNKVLAERSSHVGNLLDTCLKVKYTEFKKSKWYKVLQELLYGKDCYGKHEGVKCLIRAIQKVENDELNITPVYGNYECINSECKTCFGCEYLLGKKLFLHEVSSSFNETKENLKRCISPIDKIIHMKRIEKIYFPIIFEAIEAFGEDEVVDIIQIGNITDILRIEKNKIINQGEQKC